MLVLGYGYSGVWGGRLAGYAKVGRVETHVAVASNRIFLFELTEGRLKTIGNKTIGNKYLLGVRCYVPTEYYSREHALVNLVIAQS